MTLKLFNLKLVGALLVAAVIAATLSGPASAQSIPPIPAIYAGTITAAGAPVPDGFTVFARVGPTYVSNPVTVRNGTYTGLGVGPPANAVGDRIVTFHLGNITADQTDTWSSGRIVQDFNLTFSRLPDPTPTPSPIPTDTPTPAPIPPTPVHTPTPTIADPMTFSTGLVIVTGGVLPPDAVLTARIGDYV